jgi:molybdopterin-guanine dinucleotide biosynthesis protein A
MLETAAILVGGQAQRFGGVDKSLLTIAGRTVLDRQLEALHGVVDRVFLVDGEATRASARTGIETVFDIRPGCGSLGGIFTALTSARGPVLVVACDMPFLTTAFLVNVCDALAGVDVALPRTEDGLHPLCAAYSPVCLGPMARHLDEGRYKVADAIRGLRLREIGPDEIAPFDPDGLLLTNLNTPDDLARAATRFTVSGA